MTRNVFIISVTRRGFYYQRHSKAGASVALSHSKGANTKGESTENRNKKKVSSIYLLLHFIIFNAPNTAKI